MTRHSKNCTANAVYSYHEKQKDAKVSGYGSLKMRMSKDAIKDFDCCSLSLQVCREPILTKEGILFDRQSILEYMVAKKNEINRKMKEFEKQCKREQLELEELAQAEQRSKVEKLLKAEGVSSTSSATPPAILPAPKVKDKAISNMVNGKDKKLPAFWLPSLTPHAAPSRKEKPDKTVYCPVTCKPLKIKDFIDVKFTKVNESDERQSLQGKRDRYKCPVSGDVLGNNIPCAILRTTGDVVTMEVVKLIKKDMQHPINGQKLSDSDIIPIIRGGTGFSTVNGDMAIKKHRPVLQA
ncbi:unnamed protein product, partial [Meganyctiphanes norvegica]